MTNLSYPVREKIPSQVSAASSRQNASPQNLREVLRVLLRRRIWIIASILLCGSLAVLYSLITKPVYQAVATVELDKSSGGTADLNIGDMLQQQFSSVGEGLQTDLETESEILRSDSLAIKVIEQLNLTAYPPFLDKKHPATGQDVSWENNTAARTRLLQIFASHLKVSPVPGTRLIKVTYLSYDPRQAAEVANALIESYKQQYLETHYAAVSEASGWLTKQLSDLKANVENSEKRLTDFEKASGILTAPTEATFDGGGSMPGGEIHSVVLQKLDALNAELTAAETDRLQKEAIYRLAKAGNPDVIIGLKSNPMVQGSMAFAQGGGTSNLEELELRQSGLKTQLAEALTVYGPKNRHLQDLDTQIKAVGAEIHDEMEKLVQRAGADLQIAQQTENAIRARFNEQQEEATKLNEKNVQLSVLSQEALSSKKLYEDLYTKLQEADISAGIKATNITIVDPARPQANPVRPRPLLYVELGLLIGAFLGMGIAYLIESIDNRVSSLTEVEEITGFAVIGVIPEFEREQRERRARLREKSESQQLMKASNGDLRDSSAWVLTHPNSIAAEAFRSLRTAVFLSKAGGVPKTILVTSCIPAEGKSTVSSNLAITIAQHGKKVVVIEADMRRPTMTHVLNLPDNAVNVGLSNVLAGTTSLDEALIRGVGVENLDVLVAGPRPPLPSELLGSLNFDAMLDELRSRYDVVVIDSPPALLITDAVSLSPRADAIVWVVRAGSVTRPYLTRATQLIQRGRMDVIGFVLNRFDRQADPYGYGYGYGYPYAQYGAYYGADQSNGSR